jgi:hypothetical protein
MLAALRKRERRGSAIGLLELLSSISLVNVEAGFWFPGRATWLRNGLDTGSPSFVRQSRALTSARRSNSECAQMRNSWSALPFIGRTEVSRRGSPIESDYCSPPSAATSSPVAGRPRDRNRNEAGAIPSRPKSCLDDSVSVGPVARMLDRSRPSA